MSNIPENIKKMWEAAADMPSAFQAGLRAHEKKFGTPKEIADKRRLEGEQRRRDQAAYRAANPRLKGP